MKMGFFARAPYRKRYLTVFNLFKGQKKPLFSMVFGVLL